ncbi:MAG: hypothetical protein HY722_00005, partial [Planctomycetes bacterium]|nr:hypothetical protein [Planctomycetota bacterium]
DLDGVQARARGREDHDGEGFWGVRDGGEELRGARAATRVAGTARAGLTAVTAEDPLGRWDGVGGADLDLEGERLRLRGEVARREAAGRGGFAALELRPDEHLRVEGQRRDYQGFVVDHNNAPIYTGVSGGEDRDERGSGLLVGLSPGEAVDLTARYDTTRRREQRPRRLSDAAYEATLYFSEGTDLTLGYEQEWSRLDVIRILNARTSHQTEAGRRLELDWNRDDDPAGLLETLRAELRLPLGSEGRYSLRLADTWRSSVEGQGHEPQVQTDWDLSEDASLSARYTAREGEPAEDRFTVTLVARF